MGNKEMIYVKNGLTQRGEHSVADESRGTIKRTDDLVTTMSSKTEGREEAVALRLKDKRSKILKGGEEKGG